MNNNLTLIQKNVLIASIIGDGETTKIYPDNRRKNNSYREHYGKDQMEYRKWKKQFMGGLLYLTPRSNPLISKSSPLFTKLYPLFYTPSGDKKIPLSLLSDCTLPHFLAILYMDDGSLCITTRINHKNKLIYLSPQIYLYLQNYPLNQLRSLKKHIKDTFHINLIISKIKNGHGYILRTTVINEALKLLKLINPVTKTCSFMFYKTNWEYRLQKESQKYSKSYSDYQILTSSSNRVKPYREEEINKMILLKKQQITDEEIAKRIGRTYWSVVYKLSDLRKRGIYL